MDRSRQPDSKPGSQPHDSTHWEGTSPAPLWLAGLHLTPPVRPLPSCQAALEASPECCSQCYPQRLDTAPRKELRSHSAARLRELGLRNSAGLEGSTFRTPQIQLCCHSGPGLNCCDAPAPNLGLPASSAPGPTRVGSSKSVQGPAGAMLARLQPSTHGALGAPRGTLNTTQSVWAHHSDLHHKLVALAAVPNKPHRASFGALGGLGFLSVQVRLLGIPARQAHPFRSLPTSPLCGASPPSRSLPSLTSRAEPRAAGVAWDLLVGLSTKSSSAGRGLRSTGGRVCSPCAVPARQVVSERRG